MKKHTSFLGRLLNKGNRQNLEVKVDLIEYADGGIFFVYSPALDLIGYGNTEIEARESWEVVLEEYVSYTANKNTLVEDLTNRGWNVKKDRIEFTPPSLTWMLENITELENVYNKHDFQKRSRSVRLPVYA